MAETNDCAVAVLIAGTPSETLLEMLDLGIRTELYHSERNGRARKCVAITSCSDKGVDIVEGSFFSRLGGKPFKRNDRKDDENGSWQYWSHDAINELHKSSKKGQYKNVL
jgi:hypothetical protein